MANKKEISVLDFSAKYSMTIIEVYRLIDEGEIKSKRVNKKDVILLDS